MVVKKKIMKIDLKRRISLILFVVLVGSLLFFNHSFYFGSIFISFVVVNEYLYEKFKKERREHYNETTEKLIDDLECMISGTEIEEDDNTENNSENRSEEICL